MAYENTLGSSQKMLNKLHQIIFHFIFLCLFCFTAIAAELLPFASLKKIPQFSLDQKQILAHSSVPNHFFLIDPNGRVDQLINGELIDKAFFDLSQQITDHDVELTAFILHPNYSLKDQPGYHTFYTAHIELHQSELRVARIPKIAPNYTTHDLVINEWKSMNIKKVVDPSSKREIVRIASPDANTQIKQLSFNPYTDKWHDSFGFLHITINENSNYKDVPLYSGALLRINPKKFGLRSYTIPKNNPFIKDTTVNNEIVLLGAGNIQQITWQKRRNTEWFLLIKEDNKTILRKGLFSNDLRNSTVDAIWQNKSNNALKHIVWYQGRELVNHIYKFIYLVNINKTWQLRSLSITPDQHLEMHTALPDLSSDSTPTLSLNHAGELVIIDTNSNLFHRLITPANEATKAGINSSANNNEQSDEKSLIWIAIILLIMMSMAVAIVLFYKRHVATRNPLLKLKRQYARITFTEPNHPIILHQWRKKTATTSLDSTSIISSTLFLNGEKINYIDNNHLFTNEINSKLLKVCLYELRLKMVDNKARTIELVLKDIQKNTHKICLYARIGNQRYTKLHYRDCLSVITNFCTLISTTIEQNNATVHKKRNTPSIQDQAISNDIIDEYSDPMDTTQPELVKSLEEIVKLKQQGFLTDEEFDNAKRKLLASFTDK
jgi:hypothetical protein